VELVDARLAIVPFLSFFVDKRSHDLLQIVSSEDIGLRVMATGGCVKYQLLKELVRKEQPQEGIVGL